MTTITIERELLEQMIERFTACSCEVCTRQSIEAISAALAAPATAPEQCWCDEQGIGKPGVSCGDCPTRDYKTTAPEQPAWHDAPDAPGIWMSSLNDAARRLDEFDVEHMAKNPWPNRRWFGPIPEDKP